MAWNLCWYFFTNIPDAKNGIPINAKFLTYIIGNLIPKTERPSPSIKCKNTSESAIVKIILSFT